MAFPSIWGAPFAINPVSQALAREIALKRKMLRASGYRTIDKSRFETGEKYNQYNPNNRQKPVLTTPG
jgi:hypothetical protein